MDPLELQILAEAAREQLNSLVAQAGQLLEQPERLEPFQWQDLATWSSEQATLTRVIAELTAKHTW